jgi:uncharacterized protein (TIGR02452 family)
MDLKALARETAGLVDAGAYANERGERVDLRPLLEAARAGTRVYRPGQLRAVPARPNPPGPPRIEVTSESTMEAAYRLAREGEGDVAVLNFASALEAGGGWLRGATAQEEALARASALVACLEAAPAFYAANRTPPSDLYTDHVIHSPRVPFFRDDRHRPLDAPIPLSVITAPAPYAGGGIERPLLRMTLERRAAVVLAVAADQGHPALVLGAWGCGAFRNDPDDVASVFSVLLKKEAFSRPFRRIVFAVLSPEGDSPNLAAFRRAFA